VLIRTVTTGVDLDPDGYTVYVYPPVGPREVHIRANDSVLIDQLILTPGGGRAALHGLTDNCWVASTSSRQFPLSASTIGQVVFTVECVPVATTAAYYRASGHEHAQATHGGLSERYVLSADGRLRLQYSSGRWGSFEYIGTYTRGRADNLNFGYGDDGRWTAAATLRGDTWR
jgi:hypothetical protein